MTKPPRECDLAPGVANNPNLKEAVMPGEERSYCVFEIQYTRQRGTNRWKAKTNEVPGMQALKAEGIMGFSTSQMEGQTKADENHATIHVSIERDPRFFDLSRELEEARIAMTEKAIRIADGEFRKRYPGAEIKHGQGGDE